ncbi:hypothetical protein DFJ73DRAFT_855832 [Zopfochytrium polystomum]|nr:hypothetical protein DFJ73DRAFT_855832 [Zopfochytrium polystomum]
MPIAALLAIAPSILAYLPGPDRFRLATLLRIKRSQALAIYSIPSASLVEASRRGLVDLLEFRLRTATIRIGSAAPVESLFWILRSSETTQPDPRLSAPRGSPPSLRIEWWDDPTDHAESSYSAVGHTALIAAASNNRVDVLEWWLSNEQILCYTEVKRQEIALKALFCGAVDALIWCRDSLGWSPDDVHDWHLQIAATRNHANVLHWLETEAGEPMARRILPVEYTDESLQLLHLRRRQALHAEDPLATLTQLGTTITAAANGQVKVLDWLRTVGVDFDERTMAEIATELGHVDVLNWWRSNYPSFWLPEENSVLEACSGGYVDVLQFWWDIAGEEAIRPDHSFWDAVRSVAVLQWCAKRFPPPDPCASQSIIAMAFQRENVELLSWIKTSGYVQPLECGFRAASTSAKAFSWWTRNGLPLTNDIDDMDFFIKNNLLRRDLMRWLVSMRDNDTSGVWSCIPRDEDWPRLDLVHIGAKSHAMSKEWSDSYLDAQEWWWRDRGLRLGSGQDLEWTLCRSAEKCVPFLEWLAARELGIPVCSNPLLFQPRARRWWEEAKNRFPPSAFLQSGNPG